MDKVSKRIYVLLSNDLYTDQRVHKVCLFLLGQNFDPILLGRKLPSSLTMNDRPYAFRRFKLWFKTGPLFYANLNFKLFFFLLIRKTPWILANDLDTLPAAYLIKKFHPSTQLVYDTHEFYTGVPELISRPKVQDIWKKIESTIFPSLTKIYTVNDSIAQKYQQLYNKDLLVIRNMAPIKTKFSEIDLGQHGIQTGLFTIILQGAGINVDRGAEEAVEAMKQIEGAILIILGNGDVVPHLKQYVEKEDLSKKVYFLPRKSYDEMLNFTHVADLGLSLDKPINPNYEMSLPNKVFDYLQAETPILASPVKEIVALLKDYSFGEVISAVTSNEIAQAVNVLIKNPEKLEQYKSNCIRYKNDLCWEKEVQKLKSIYK
jgi:glycosyltransferase involved in cell wall biosynthesis